MTRSVFSRIAWLIILLGVGSLLSATSAAASSVLKVESLSNTTAQPGQIHQYLVQVSNFGDSPSEGEIVLVAHLDPALSAVEGSLTTNVIQNGGSSHPCEITTPKTVICTTVDPLLDRFTGEGTDYMDARITATVDPGAEGTMVSSFEASGGGAPSSVQTIDPTVVSGALPSFGVDAFDAAPSTDAGGAIATAAASHPYAVSATLDFNITSNPLPLAGLGYPVEPLRDAVVELPPGLLGNPNVLATCTLAQLSNGVGNSSSRPLCSPQTQAGTASLRFDAAPLISSDFGPVPVYRLAAPPGVPARFGLNVLSAVIVLDARVRAESDYGLSIVSRQISEVLGVAGTSFDFWGVPASPDHDVWRGCSGEVPPFLGGPNCASTDTPRPFLRLPTTCTPAGIGLPFAAHIDSWEHQGVETFSGVPDLSDPNWRSASFETHQAPGYPYPPSAWGDPVGVDRCDAVPFTPNLSAQPTTEAADSPTGLDLHLSVPQECWQHYEQGCQSDLKDAEVKLPAGMTLNPSAADGLGACTEQQIGYKRGTSDPFEFTPEPAACPDSSKVGEVTITTPLLEAPLKGAVYLAKQTENPFGSLLAMYLVAEGSGVVVKQAGEIEISDEGSLTTRFSDAPQTPFSDLHLTLFGGPRAALRTPPTCGTFATRAILTPWSGNADVHADAGFEITSGPSGSPCPNSGFDPHFTAGTTNPLAGATSPFTLRMTREDGTKEITGLKTTLPKGLVAYLKGIPYCSDATLAAISHDLGAGAGEIASPSCPAASLVGHVSAGAGAGPNPFYTSAGRAYWAGPYHGAPVSLAVVFPAVAGPFDLGNVVIRNGFEVNPETAQITAVSDPIPTSLFGIGLDLRDVRVELDRPNYVLNPTSCDVMSFDATISGAGGTSAQRSERFQAGGCDRLGFKPKLSLSLRGSHTRRGHPALKATLTMPQGGANIASAQVALPPTELLDNAHIGTVCTRVQYREGTGGGANCPPRSLIGHAAAYSPILDYYLQGPVYLRSSDNPLPDLVASLGGQIQVDVVGKVDSAPRTGALRTTFASVPDAPVSKFVLTMAGGKKGLLQNSTNLCKGTHRATALFDAQNGKTRDLQPVVKADCGGKHGGKGKGKGSYRHGGVR